MTKSFPQYIRELEGVAHGSGVEFHKVNIMKAFGLMMMIIYCIDLLELALLASHGRYYTECRGTPKCSQSTNRLFVDLCKSAGLCEFMIMESLKLALITLFYFASQEILAHTEDALKETLNHFYFVSAHIIESSPQGKHKVRTNHFKMK